jgi:hypothetical protein
MLKNHNTAKHAPTAGGEEIEHLPLSRRTRYAGEVAGRRDAVEYGAVTNLVNTMYALGLFARQAAPQPASSFPVNYDSRLTPQYGEGAQASTAFQQPAAVMPNEQAQAYGQNPLRQPEPVMAPQSSPVEQVAATPAPPAESQPASSDAYMQYEDLADPDRLDPAEMLKKAYEAHDAGTQPTESGSAA